MAATVAATVAATAAVALVGSLVCFWLRQTSCKYLFIRARGLSRATLTDSVNSDPEHQPDSNTTLVARPFLSPARCLVGILIYILPTNQLQQRFRLLVVPRPQVRHLFCSSPVSSNAIAVPTVPSNSTAYSIWWSSCCCDRNRKQKLPPFLLLLLLLLMLAYATGKSVTSEPAFLFSFCGFYVAVPLTSLPSGWLLQSAIFHASFPPAAAAAATAKAAAG